MDFFKDKRKRKIFIILTTIITLLLVLILNIFLYIGDYYEGDIQAIDACTNNNDIEYKIVDDNIIYEVENPIFGLIFYPGGKVEYNSYIPLMEELASKGVLCVILKMPLNLAILDIDAADGILDMYPEVDNWYVGGHSLGGSIASMYVKDHLSEFKGVILLGSYLNADLSKDNLKVISIYGSEDKVLNHNKYLENKKYLPNDFIEVIIDGGCHSYFGMYGLQDGDGIPTITNIEQINLTTNAIINAIS